MEIIDEEIIIDKEEEKQPEQEEEKEHLQPDNPILNPLPHQR